MDAISKVLDFAGEALKLRAERQRVIASNVANADTPGFKARDFDFARALSQATSATGVQPGSLATTNARHLGPAGNSLSTVSLAWRQPAQTSLDGNTVEIDAERAKFAENTVHYEATLRFMNSRIKTILTAIQGQ
jgi:flagellar basal-body rod protein FlgB